MRCNGLLGGEVYRPGSKAQGHQKMCSIVRSTISMWSILMLGGSGGMPPRKNLKRCSEIESEAILELKYMHVF